MKPNFSYNAIIVAKSIEEAKSISTSYMSNGKYGAWCKPCLFLSLKGYALNVVEHEDCRYVITKTSMLRKVKDSLDKLIAKDKDNELMCWRVRCFECRNEFDRKNDI